MPVQTEPERQIERDADELEERIDRLGDDIDEAQRHVQAREEDGEDVAGDWEDTDEADGEGAEGFDDPEDLDLDDEDLLDEGEEEE
jgi:hypothetical protein